MHLLVVEDERALCETIVRSLRRLAYSVDYCCDGDKALELLGVERYDLVLLDLNLPGKDGMTVLRTLRHPGGVSAQYLPALLPGGQVSQPGIRWRRTGALTGMGDRRPPRRLRLGREKFREGHYHCGGVANATIN